MSEINDTATVTLNVNGAQAKRMMSELETKIEQTNAKISSLKANMADPKDIEKARKDLKTYQTQLDEMKSAAAGVTKALDNLDAATPRQIERALRTLNRQLKDMTPGTDVWNSHIEKIQVLKKRLADLKGGLETQESVWMKFRTWSVSAWPAFDILRQGYEKLTGIVNEYVETYATMDSAMANTQKFTGMTRDQVESLNEEFKKMDTRTSREGLNELAQSAGRLGKQSVEDVMGFVRAGDIIGVAMDELGSDAPEIISKLAGIFNLESEMGTEKAMLSVGSAINSLTQSYAASAPSLVDFANRMGATASQTNMAMHEMLAFGTLLDANGVSVEKSATALQGVISKMYATPKKFAEQAGLDVNAFTEALKRSSTEGVLMFVEALSKMDQMQLNATLKELKISGSGITQTFQTLAGKSQDLNRVLAESKTAFNQATSATEEYNVQNNTAQAKLDKIKKRFHDLQVEIGEKLYPLMGHLMTSVAALSKGTSVLINFLTNNWQVILSLTAGVTAYNIAVNLSIIKTKLLAVAQGIAKVATIAWTAVTQLSAAAVALFTGNITRASIAFKAFSATLKLSPIGLIAGAATALVGVLISLKSKTNEVDQEFKEWNESLTDLSKTTSDFAADELANAKSLYIAATDEAKSMDIRREAAEKLQKQYPDYFGNLTTEQVLIGQAKSQYDSLTESILSSARARAAASKIQENEKELLTLEEQQSALENQQKTAQSSYNAAVSARREALKGSATMQVGGGIAPATAAVDIANVHSAENAVDNAKDALDSVNSAIQENLRKQEAIRVANKTLADKYKASASNPVVKLPEDHVLPTTLNPTQTSLDDDDDWKKQQIAQAQIDYYTGVKDYDEYRQRLLKIDADYYDRCLSRDNLSSTERLELQASYAEVQKKLNQEIAKSKSQSEIESENERYSNLKSTLQSNFASRLESQNLSAEERTTAERVYDQSMELAELHHLRRLVELTEAGTQERKTAEQAYLDARLAAARRHQQQYEQDQQKHEQNLADFKKRFFGESPIDKAAAYDADLKLLTQVYNAELAAAEGNTAEKLRIEEAFLQGKLALQKQYDQEGANNSHNALKSAMAQSVEWLNSDGGKAVTGALSALTSGMSAMFSGISTLVQAELDLEAAAIEKRYEKEVVAAQGNSYKVAQLEKKKEQEIAKAKNEANKKMFAMQVIQAVAQTAQNALSAYGSAAAIPLIGYILAPIAAGMAVAAGAIQIAAIKKQQQAAEAQGYSQGGFTKPGRVDEPAGIVHAGEWVASQKLLASPVARPMIEALDYAQRTNTVGSLRAEDVSRSIRAHDSLARIAESDGTSALVAAAVAQNAQAVIALNARLNEPFITVNTVTGDRGIKAAQDEYTRLINNKSPKYRRNAVGR